MPHKTELSGLSSDVVGSHETIPLLRQVGRSQQLFVHGKPFLMLGGEVQNSQFSSARYMEPMWAELKAANVNTVFGAVSWEQIEPVEGRYTFHELDNIIRDARKHELKLVLLWFGGFKNALSTYVPPWVKVDQSRFPRAKIKVDHRLATADAVSVFCPGARTADARAFGRLMTHLKEIDQEQSTVIMVQVENEVGILGDSRDRSDPAESAWQSPVPTGVLDVLHAGYVLTDSHGPQGSSQDDARDMKKERQWAELIAEFGTLSVEELFMAYHFAQYVEAVAAAGKRAYPLPLYTNVWQNYNGPSRDLHTSVSTVAAGGSKPGDYPSGGGVAGMLAVWKKFAPSLDLIAPDIYLNDYEATCKAYRFGGQSVLIPEQRRDEYHARRIWSAYGTHHCIGTAPFGIDTLTPETNPYRQHYGLLDKVSWYVLEARADGKRERCRGFFFDELRDDGSDPSPALTIVMGSWELLIQRARVFGRPSAGSGMVIEQADGIFLLVGWAFQVSFKRRDNPTFVGILRCEEKEIDARTGELQTLRSLNGDETQSGACAVMPAVEPDYGEFPIAITIPAHTAIAIVEPYALYD